MTEKQGVCENCHITKTVYEIKKIDFLKGDKESLHWFCDDCFWRLNGSSKMKVFADVPKNVPKKDRTNFVKDKTSMHKPEPKKMQVHDYINKLFGLDR